MKHPLVKLLLRAVISVGLLVLILYQIEPEEVIGRLDPLLGDPVKTVFAAGALVLLFVAQSAVMGLRWQILNANLGIDVPWRRCFELILIGIFFNQALPSSIGGDVVRVWRLTRLGVRAGQAIASVVIDRTIGFLTLVLIIGGSLVLLLERLTDATARASLGALVVASLLGLGALMLAAGPLRRMSERARWRPLVFVLSLLITLRETIRRPSALWRLLGLSILIHVITVLVVYALASGLGVALSFLDCLLLVPPIMLVTTLPISVAGWGVREGAMVVGLGFLGVTASDALAVSICLGLLLLIVGGVGGLVWFFSKDHTLDRGAIEELSAEGRAVAYGVEPAGAAGRKLSERELF
jgi:uncharacterized membrane protein YbhN (UPF0104 family)